MPRPLLSLLVLVLFAAGCGSEPANPANGSAPTTPTSAASASYSASLTACDALTPEMVAAEAGVDVGTVRRTYSSGSMCHYEWDGGKAELSSLRIHETADAARGAFELAHRELTAEDRAAASAAISEELARQREAGEVTAEQEELGAALGGVAAERAGTVPKVPVEGVGERALYVGAAQPYQVPVTNRTYYGTISQLHVLDGNLRFDLQGYAAEFDATAPPPDGVLDRNRDFTVSLAQRILAEAR